MSLYLCVETIKGRKDLFQGLALQHLEQKWDAYAIFHIDLATKNYEDGNALDDMLLEYVASWEQSRKNGYGNII